ncbi:MAG TPA: hypothetical protein VNZ45_10035 [Bacteroidia bacterium]|jgi:hypothetical protein|nr:hypothetical protein [Bacteroidia bacterium]
MPKRVLIILLVFFLFSGCTVGRFNTKTYQVHIDNEPKLNAISIRVDSSKARKFIIQGNLNDASIRDTTFIKLIKNKNCTINIWDTSNKLTFYQLQIKESDWKGKSIRIHQIGNRKLTLGDVFFGIIVILAGV